MDRYSTLIKLLCAKVAVKASSIHTFEFQTSEIYTSEHISTNPYAIFFSSILLNIPVMLSHKEINFNLHSRVKCDFDGGNTIKKTAFVEN